MLVSILLRLGEIEKFLHRSLSKEGHIMAAIDDLKAAVDSAVAEMSAAADFIKNHPATQTARRALREPRL